MIVSDSRKRVFCHVPKNGGSSIRRYLLSEWSDDGREYQGRHPVDAVDGAQRDLTHITPLEADAWFGDHLLDSEYQVTAIIRDPINRFASALLQHTRSFIANEKHFVTAELIEEVGSQTSFEDLCNASASDISCIYFRPQVDFIEGVPQDRQDLVLLEDVQHRFPGLNRDNPGGSLPQSLRALNRPLVKKALGRLSPTLKSSLARKMIKEDPAVKTALDRLMADHRDFIEVFYSADQLLYREQSVSSARSAG